MADVDGLESDPANPSASVPHGAVPILALTAYTSPEQVAQCLDAGMDGHVPKPVDYETLIRMIDDVTTRACERTVIADKTPGEFPTWRPGRRSPGLSRITCARSRSAS